MHYLALFILLILPAAFADAKTIHFVLSKDEAIYQQAQQAIQAELAPDLSVHKVKQTIDNFSTETLQITDLIVTIGNKAASDINKLGLNNSTIYSFTDNALIADLDHSNKQTQWAVIPLNQPLKRSITVAEQLAQASYKNKIIVVSSEDNQDVLAQLNALNERQHSRLEIVKVAKDELAAKQIEPYLFDAAVLVAVNDKHIWSGNSAKWLLQQAFTHRVPVIGYSKKFLAAGAVVSVYSPLNTLSRVCAELINDWSRTSKLKEQEVIYPKAQIDVNSNIARSLHIPINITDSLSVSNQ